jgi:LCP family protein required for cell wall assembly
VEHRPRHSRARRRPADDPPPGSTSGRHAGGTAQQPHQAQPRAGRRRADSGRPELTNADLRALRELLRDDDRADTPVVPRAVSDPDARPRHAADRPPHPHPGPRPERRRERQDTADGTTRRARPGTGESTTRRARPDTGDGTTRRARPGTGAAGGPTGVPGAAPVIGRRAARRRAMERSPRRDRGADPAEADTEIITGRAARALRGAVSDRTLSRARQALVYGRRGLAALFSLVVLIGTGYGWASVSNLQDNLNKTDVISAVPKDMPSDGAIDILLVGSDSRTDANGDPLPLEVLKLLRTEESAGLNTDTIILIRVPEDGGNAHAVSIPRDTYVPIPGYREDKINTAYGVSKRLAGEKLRAEGGTDEPAIDRQAAVAGQRVLVQTVEALTGAKIDHYAEINLYGFYLLTEAVGGVEVCLKRSTKDSDSGADFRKGRQVVSGGDALAFVRQRKNLPRGDLDRIVRQQVFMAALANRMLGAGTLADPGKLSGLMDAAQKSVVLDDGWDVLGFARQLQGIAAGSVEFVTIPVLEVGARNERGQSIITVDPATVRAFVAGLIADPSATADPAAAAPTGGATPSAQAAPAAPATVDPSSFVVTARNGTNSSGLAGRVLDRLSANGFRVGQPDNGPLRPTSEIRVAPGARAVGERIVAVLGPMPIVEDPAFAADRPRILLGADYTGPGAQSLLSDPLLRLDGARTPAHAAQPTPTPTPAPDDDAPITAEGITCVN